MFLGSNGWIEGPSFAAIVMVVPFMFVIVFILAITSRMMAQATTIRRCLVMVTVGVWVGAVWSLITALVLSLWTDPFEPGAIWFWVSLGFLLALLSALNGEPPAREPLSEAAKFVQGIMARGMRKQGKKVVPRE
ncbi:MAG TPA: hypothetical protein VF042_03945 [Gemmatimonadaceae bacterium]